MDTIYNTPVELHAAPGHKLTQSADVPLHERVFATTVRLAVNDSPDNWREVADSYAEEIINEQAQEDDLTDNKLYNHG